MYSIDESTGEKKDIPETEKDYIEIKREYYRRKNEYLKTLGVFCVWVVALCIIFGLGWLALKIRESGYKSGYQDGYNDGGQYATKTVEEESNNYNREFISRLNDNLDTNIDFYNSHYYWTYKTQEEIEEIEGKKK